MGRLHSADQRSKKINIDKMTPDQLVALAGAIGKTVAPIMKKAREDVQKILDVYGLDLILKYDIVGKNKKNKNESPEETVNTDKTENSLL